MSWNREHPEGGGDSGLIKNSIPLRYVWVCVGVMNGGDEGWEGGKVEGVEERSRGRKGRKKEIRR